MTGSTPFQIEPSENFNCSFKKLFKIHGSKFRDIVTEILEALIEEPFPIKSRNEPLPGKIQLPEGWTFHKLEFKFSQGASGQIRLMYLVNSADYIIKLVWIYSHEQFAKRPADKDIKIILRNLLD